MKKTMRKSALLSSVAMLIVSAIVLTSATYAWFSASDKAEVTGIQAEVTATSGLLISLDEGDSWGTSFTADDIDCDIPAPFAPVSSKDGNVWVTGDYESSKLTLEAAEAGKQYIAFPLWLQGPVDEDVDVNVTFSGTDSYVQKVLKFALVEEGTTMTKAIPALDSDPGYNGTSLIGDASSFTKGGAFETTDESLPIGVGTADDYNFKITASHGGSADDCVKYMAYLWVEGNDADCDGTKFGADKKIAFGIDFNIDLTD